MANLVYPDYNKNLYALSNSILRKFGIESEASAINLDIPKNKNVSVAILDGFGYNLFNRVNDGEFESLRLTSTFPSTTSTALATFFLNATPGQHGIVGYRLYYRRIGDTIKPLSFTYASAGRPGLLNHLGEMRDFFPSRNIFSRLYRQRKIKSSVIVPIDTYETEFSKLMFDGATKIIPYHSIWDAIELYRQELLTGNSKFVAFYAPYIDTLEHAYGPDSGVVMSAAQSVYKGVLAALKSASNKVYGMITSDHGQVRVNHDVELNENTALLSKLETPPYGDGRAILLRSRADIRNELSRYDMKIFSKDEGMKLFGAVDENMVKELPDFIGVPLDDSTYHYSYGLWPSKSEKHEVYAKNGSHGGIFAEEMEIPLVLVE